MIKFGLSIEDDKIDVEEVPGLVTEKKLDLAKMLPIKWKKLIESI